MSTRSSFSLPAGSRKDLGGCFPRIVSTDDVITNFFNQIVQYVIEDMVVLEEEEEVEVTPEISQQITIDYKELKPEDLVSAEVTSAEGSNITLTKKTSSEKKMGKSSLDVIQEENLKSSTASSSLQSSMMEEERRVKIIFTNGNIYEGYISKRIMNGKGRYTWVDGTVYEGDFKDGFPTGRGKMTLPDLSYYDGEFNQGLFHGRGFLNVVSTPTFYSGQWKNGMKHGQGWLLYEPGDWYEGGWTDDLKEGFGLRYYKDGAKYRGMWHRGKYANTGIMIWENHDFYKGEWENGLMHGEGEYIWRAFYNDTFAFPLQNTYRGAWKGGKRCGRGVMWFGDDSGLKLKGQWDQDFKHGDGCFVCGNGKVVESRSLFSYDKPTQIDCSMFSMPSTSLYHVLNLPIFIAPEFVDVGFYVERLLKTLKIVESDDYELLKSQEEKCIKNILLRYLPELRELYQEYATIAAKTNLHFQPVLIRLFLWQFYKDRDISKCGIALARIDQLLAENPKSCLDTIHDPFEPIYFWQFLMSLVSVGLTVTPLDDITGNFSSVLMKKFLDEVIFVKEFNHKNTVLLNYLDLAPIKGVYRLYRKLGETHTARAFLRESCTKRGDPPLWCHYDVLLQKGKTQFGTNLVPLDHHVAFTTQSGPELDDVLKHRWTNLFDFRHLGAKNVTRCLSKACPLIMSEDLVVNINHPLTFLEFYETLLACIFMVLELEMKKEKEMLEKHVSPRQNSRGSTKVASSDDAKKTTKKKAGKKKKNRS